MTLSYLRPDASQQVPPSMLSNDVDWGLQITTGSRVSFSLIDLNGTLGRRNGMASLYLREPSFVASAFKSDRMIIEFGSDLEVHRDAVSELLELMRAKFSLPMVRVVIHRVLPAHSGSGSKTTTLLSVGRLYAALFNHEVSTASIAKLARRAGTSGASANLFDLGGYLVDGGHANPDDFANDPKKYLRPSRYAEPALKPPALINLPFPNWPVLLIKARGRKLSSSEELEWHLQNVPIPLHEAQRIAHHVLMNLSTAVAERDYVAFCKAMNNITFDQYFKQRQIAAQPIEVRELLEEGYASGIVDSIALSAAGPTCFAFARNTREAAAWCNEQKLRDRIESFSFTSARNTGYEINAIPNI